MAESVPVVVSPSLGVVLISLLAVLICNCHATTYMVGDSPGWDISTNLDTWPGGKTFHVGDVLGEFVMFPLIDHRGLVSPPIYLLMDEFGSLQHSSTRRLTA